MSRLFFRKRSAERLAGELYCPIVARARHPGLYRDLGVADTLDGRFEMLVIHVVLLLRRLRELGETEIAQAVIDLMFADLDQALREMGVSDVSVAKRIRPMAEAYAGRAQAYEKALGEAGSGALAAALERNVFTSGEADEAVANSAVRLADYMRRLDAVLRVMALEEITGGAERWPEPACAA
jgi:cytochrome b pre-mRNA-processing protein 3